MLYEIRWEEKEISTIKGKNKPKFNIELIFGMEFIMEEEWGKLGGGKALRHWQMESDTLKKVCYWNDVCMEPYHEQYIIIHSA